MARNIEIKVKIDAIENCKARAEKLADRGPVEIVQEDLFFACNEGRLKLRIIDGTAAQLIAYRRSDTSGPKLSEYKIYETDQPTVLRDALEMSNGILGSVSKVRILYIVGRTRIHIDSVQGLGEFLELEVVLSDTDTEEEGMAEARILIEKLGVDQDKLVQGAYFDLLKDCK
ncbi:MAG: class IV adenylate cyclase [Halioglobus sp.]